MFNIGVSLDGDLIAAHPELLDGWATDEARGERGAPACGTELGRDRRPYLLRGNLARHRRRAEAAGDSLRSHRHDRPGPRSPDRNDPPRLSPRRHRGDGEPRPRRAAVPGPPGERPARPLSLRLQGSREEIERRRAQVLHGRALAQAAAVRSPGRAGPRRLDRRHVRARPLDRHDRPARVPPAERNLFGGAVLVGQSGDGAGARREDGRSARPVSPRFLRRNDVLGPPRSAGAACAS